MKTDKEKQYRGTRKTDYREEVSREGLQELDWGERNEKKCLQESMELNSDSSCDGCNGNHVRAIDCSIRNDSDYDICNVIDDGTQEQKVRRIAW